MKSLLRTAAVLGAFGLVAAGILGLTDMVTREPIRQVDLKKREAARRSLLPAAHYEAIVLPPLAVLTNELAGQGIAVPPGWGASVSSNAWAAIDEDGASVGYILDVKSPAGYGGEIEMVVGIRIVPGDGPGTPVVADYMVLRSAETPGLGKTAEQLVHAFFTNLRPTTNELVVTNGRQVVTNLVVVTNRRGLASVSRDDGTTDVITGATITSLALKQGLHDALLAAQGYMLAGHIPLTVENRELYLINYTQDFSPLPLTNRATAIAELLAVTYYGREMGYIAKAAFRHEGARMLALVAFDRGQGRLAACRVYRVQAGREPSFERLEEDEARELGGTRLADLTNRPALAGLAAVLRQAALDAATILKQAGKL